MSVVGHGKLTGNLAAYHLAALPTVQDNDVLTLFIAHTTGATISTITPNPGLPKYTIIDGSFQVDIYAMKLTNASHSGQPLDITMSGISKTTVHWSVHHGMDPDNPMPSSTVNTEHDSTTTRTTPAVTTLETTDILTYIAERPTTNTTTAFSVAAPATELDEALNSGSGANNSALGVVEGAAAGVQGPFTWTVTGVGAGRRISATIGLNGIGGIPPTTSAAYKDAAGTTHSVYQIRAKDASGTAITVQPIRAL